MEGDATKSNIKFHFDNRYFEKPLDFGDFTVYQLGDLYCGDGTTTGEHDQFVPFELTITERGNGFFYTDGKCEPMKKGRAYLSLSGDRHRINSGRGDTLRYFYLAFGIKPESPLYPVGEFLKERFSGSRPRELKSRSAIDYMRRLLGEASAENEYSEEVKKAILTDLIVDIYRAETERPAAFYDTGKQDGIIYGIVKYIDENIETVHSVKEVADALFYSTGHISAVFRSVMKTGVHDYIKESKLQLGKKLIEEGLSATSAAQKINYSSVNNFSRDFKAFFGKSPSEIKNGDGNDQNQSFGRGKR